MSDTFEDDDDFLTGEEADAYFSGSSSSEEEANPDLAAQRLKLEHARSTAEQFPDDHSPFKDAIDILSEGIRSRQITNEELQDLANLLPPELFQVDSIDAEFDIMEELGQQRNLVNSLRLAIMNPGGKGLRKDVAISEAKSVMDTCRQFGETIRKNMERVNNISRVQALEAAILETMVDYPEEFKREFTKHLEHQLKIYCKDKD
ncbi:hypothetical protein VPHK449_0004 [Vibrio phage K449]